ncbi:aminotransferase class IV [Chitinophaga oryzae]|uniref:Aminotransferase class IV n=1 Tax=Chitinophaga oryzae TaxID=2725414 RepID=A0AAE6ZE24_9BACT|nr:aminotransferase class IV [Chitinophaga oryzae]QJB30964.1 aminotransferase class IV [Chitinophaga oryzae]QJB37449.1 aminotransferase class IV [Chitinophaga oryzae]
MDNTFIQELDGKPLSTADMPRLMALQYGHFTAMQVRSRKVKGLRLHLERLARSSNQLFGCQVPEQHLLDCLHHITQEQEDCSLRLNVFTTAFGQTIIREKDLYVLITKTPAVEPATQPLKVKSAPFKRLLPEIKYGGIVSGILAYRRQAMAAGFDDVLYVDEQQHISEGSIWNVGFYDGQSIVLPATPALPGIMVQLLSDSLWGNGVAVVHRNISLTQLYEYKNAFYTNSVNHRGMITQIDQQVFDHSQETLADILERAYEAVPWDNL